MSSGRYEHVALCAVDEAGDELANLENIKIQAMVSRRGKFGDFEFSVFDAENITLKVE